MSETETLDPMTLPFDEYMVWLSNHIKEREAWARKAAEKPPKPPRPPKRVRPETPRARVARLATMGKGIRWTSCEAAWRNNGWAVMPPCAYSPGVYAIYGDGMLVYVGMTDEMNVRVGTHLAKHGAALARALGREITTWIVKYRPERFYGERATLELQLIRRLKPELNRIGNRGWGNTERPAVNRNNYRRISA